MDGQKSLWEPANACSNGEHGEILDCCMPPRIWDAAHLFDDRDEEQPRPLLRPGPAPSQRRGASVFGLRQMGTKRTLRGKKREKLAKICAYLETMPIACVTMCISPRLSYCLRGHRGGVSPFYQRPDGALGHALDIESAQAMLDMRSISLKGIGTTSSVSHREETQRFTRIVSFRTGALGMAASA